MMTLDEERRAHEKRATDLAGRAEQEADDLRQQLDLAVSIAEGVRAPLDVKAIARHQCGVPVLVARCPKCKTIAGLTGEGKHLYRGCYTWLRFRHEG
jgi:hypothetical protein